MIVAFGDSLNLKVALKPKLEVETKKQLQTKELRLRFLTINILGFTMLFSILVNPEATMREMLKPRKKKIICGVRLLEMN